MKYQNILETIGHTPHVRINRLFSQDYEVWMKLERSNPGGSIKDRIAFAMVTEAEESGILKEGSVIIEPTSGNTGIGLAMVGAVKGYRVILVMPESMSVERRSILKAYGAELELTPRERGMKGSIERAHQLLEEIKGSWMPAQFDNPANPAIHEISTAQEIVADFPDGFDYLITGVGTGGHITGISRVMKQKFPDIKVFAVEPEDSPVISNGEPGPHPIMGIGAGFIPENLDIGLLDGTILVNRTEAFDYTRRVARTEGIFVGISTGASLAAVAKKLPDIPKGSRILTLNYDTGERYISVNDLF
ncbi:MAG TPA: cysteine synthase A [Bacteroidaceae bacterium]|nr:cysteine synthase A [Bacteroidaceae bacterium]